VVIDGLWDNSPTCGNVSVNRSVTCAVTRRRPVEYKG